MSGSWGESADALRHGRAASDGVWIDKACTFAKVVAFQTELAVIGPFIFCPSACVAEIKLKRADIHKYAYIEPLRKRGCPQFDRAHEPGKSSQYVSGPRGCPFQLRRGLMMPPNPMTL